MLLQVSSSCIYSIYSSPILQFLSIVVAPFFIFDVSEFMSL